MAKLKLRSLLALLGISVACVGSVLTTDTFISPSQAMQAPGSVSINFSDFIQYVKVNNLGSQSKLLGATDQDDQKKERRQQAVISQLFSDFGNQITSPQNKNDLFTAIDTLVTKHQILGMQAGVLKKYITQKVGNAFAVAPKMDFLQWTKITANTVHTYFKRPYDDTPYLDPKPGRDKIQCPDGSFVHRPNHGLGHGVRQGLYAVDIVEGLNGGTIQFTTQRGQDIQAWVQNKMANDPHFLEKVEFASAFQRTGRRSEYDKGGQVYLDYMQDDENYFRKEAAAYAGPGGMFEHDLDIYAEALSPNGTTSTDASYLKKIFVLSHRLDLRRLTYSRPTGSFQENGCNEFFGGGCTAGTNEMKFINVLWGRAGEYLRAVGDQDRDPSITNANNSTYKFRNPKVFCPLMKNPDQLAQTLVGVRKSTNYRF